MLRSVHRGVVLVVALTVATSIAAAARPSAAEAFSFPDAQAAVQTIVPHEFKGTIRDIIGRIIDRVKGDNGEHEAPPLTPRRNATDPVLQAGPPAASAPAAGATFAGLDFQNWGAGWPPDTNGDVGQTHYIQTVNTSIGVFRKSDGVRVAAFTFNDFFSGTGTPCDANNQGDPVVLYDSLSGHWIITDFAWSSSRGPFYECLAVSKGEDPTAVNGWWFYALQTSANSTLPDYPKLGVWPDGIYMSANMFARSWFGGYSYSGARVWAINRQQLEAGQSTQVIQRDVSGGSSYFSLLPSNVRGTPPPAGRPNLFASIWNSSQARIWKFSVNWSTNAASFTGPTNVSLGAWNTAPADVPTLNGNDIDTLQERLMMQNQYRNIGGQESLWLTHTVAGATSSQAAVRWYQLNVTGGNVVTSGPVQQSTYAPDGNSRFMPSLAVDKFGNMAIGYSVSSASMHPAIRYAGRLAGDPANQLTLAETSLVEGGGSPTNSCGGSACSRWGDYSAMTVDPVDGCTFWYTNEYYATDGGNWQTRIGSFAFPGCGASAPTTGTVIGRVTDSSTAAGISGVTVAVGGGPSTTTDGSGNYTLTGVTPGTVSVSASKTGYTGQTDTSVSVTAGATTTKNFVLVSTATAPNAPSLSAATNPRSCVFFGLICSGGGVRLSWSTPAANGSPITEYRIYRSLNSTVSTAGSPYDTTTGTTYTDTSTNRGTVYYYAVVAVNGIGPGPASNVAWATAG